MKILITGGHGQLARAFARLFEGKGLEYRLFAREELDISNFGQVLSVVRAYCPQLIVNCAAYNLVDKAEEDFARAFAVNALGPQYLALAARETGAFLIHFSTDYVFDGEKGDFYTEEDEPNPVNKYGLSKRLGELSLFGVSEEFLVFRVSWLFGEGKQNFLAKVWDWAQKYETLRIAYDEFSIPTYTGTVAWVSWLAYEQGLKGLYHLTSRGYCSRLEWARYFLELKRLERKVIPVSGATFGLPAKRPFFSALENRKIENDLGIQIPPWQDEVKRFVECAG